MRWTSALLLLILGTGPRSAADEPAGLAQKARAILEANCHRCHGQDGSLEGGMNYIMDRDKLISRRKIVPGQAEQSPLIRRIAGGKMPPAGEKPRPTPAELALLKQWIDAGAPAATPVNNRPQVSEAAVFAWMLADLEKQERRSRRFIRYFSLVPLANSGAGPDELESYRHALAKLLNSLSWHPRISLPRPIDTQGLVLRIDLREYQWDALLWNRLLGEYPYGILQDSAVARAVIVATGTRMPLVRVDWFVANASRAPLYYDLLQLPTNSAELERQLRVDVALDIQQERVARAGFIGSGISRNNRVLERHDCLNGAYWRTYDFDAVLQNLGERDTLLPDRRNLFAYPLGPGQTENTFQHAGGEIIFNLPNGLQGFLLINANNVRIDKGPVAIVSDPKRPDRAVEAGVSCMSCHATGILQKDDQIRDHVDRNPKYFNRKDAELIKALYAPRERMKELMEDDARRYVTALAKTGNKVGSVEVVMTMTLRYEADVDLPTLAAEVGLRPEELLPKLTGSEVLARNLGALRSPGTAVARQVVVQAFGDLVRELRLGGVFQPSNVGQTLPDNTGEIDPLEAQSSPANAVAFSPNGKLAAFASADKTVVIWEVEGNRELRRCIGHTASLWAVAFSADGTRILSGGKDGSIRLWETESARELLRLEGHGDLVTALAFAPDGKRALSAGLDHEVLLWDLERGAAIKTFALRNPLRYVNAVAFTPDGGRCLVCAGNSIHLLDARTGEPIRTFSGHTGWVNCAACSTNGRWLLSGADDRTLRLWDVDTGEEVRAFAGHDNGVKSVAFSPDGQQVLSGSSDATVRLWELATGKELRQFRKHTQPLAGAVFTAGGRQTLSASRDAVVHLWNLPRPTVSPTPDPAPRPIPTPTPRPIPTVLLPKSVVPVGGTIGSLRLSPDNGSVYYLNLTAGKLARLNLRTGQRDAVLELEEWTAMDLSPNGKLLVAVTAARDKQTGGACRVQRIDPVTMKVMGQFTVPGIIPYDVAVANSGMLFVSGDSGDWSEVAVLDALKEKVLGRWGGFWTRSFLQLAPDQKRLYISSQGVPPGTLDVLPNADKFDDKPATYRAPYPGRQPLGGEFLVTPDGRYLLCKNGTVLRLSPERGQDLQFHTALEPFVAVAVDPALKMAFVLGRESTLDVYSYPEFQLRSSHRLEIVATGIVCAGREGGLVIAGFDPRTVAERPRARGFGDLFLYPLPK